NVTVKYVDEAGKEIHDAQTLSGKLGTAYDATTQTYKLAIPGYTLDEDKLPANGKGTFKEAAQTVTYVYKANATVDNVTVKYVDEAGKEIHDAQTLSGKLGTAYDATTQTYKLAIPGYTLDEDKLPANGKGTFKEAAQTVTYVYKANATVNNVTVKYVDEAGKEIHDAQTLSGKLGTAYDATTQTYKLAIPGYTLDEKKLPANGKGTFKEAAQTVTYVYKANAT
ncbi:MucBP domain-containing protein, partial [Enterococcus faecalis]|uniref:MucBP domain-containing protein n=1 Tax=Enterococcus faecalis TaxID=1351 RepID=UPI003D11D3C7